MKTNDGVDPQSGDTRLEILPKEQTYKLRSTDNYDDSHKSAVYANLQRQGPPPAVPDGYILQECLKKHGFHLDTHVLDGCKKFVLAADTCACGCPRSFHRILEDDLYGECLKNHGAKINAHKFDDCVMFIPSNIFCICGCSYDFHRVIQYPGGTVQTEESCSN